MRTTVFGGNELEPLVVFTPIVVKPYYGLLLNTIIIGHEEK